MNERFILGSPNATVNVSENMNGNNPVFNISTFTIDGASGNIVKVSAASTTSTTTSAATLSSIAVAPASPASLAVGSTQAFTATGTYSDG